MVVMKGQRQRTGRGWMGPIPARVSALKLDLRVVLLQVQVGTGVT